jgi:hypothetical protein
MRLEDVGIPTDGSAPITASLPGSCWTSNGGVATADPIFEASGHDTGSVVS